jgi:hypothetical protein
VPSKNKDLSSNKPNDVLKLLDKNKSNSKPADGEKT